MTSLESPVGTQLRVTGVRLPAKYALRRNEMGTQCGSLTHVTDHAAFGERVVGVAESHYGLEAATATLIEVEPVRSLP